MTSLGQEVPADAGLRQLCLTMRVELRRFLMARRMSEADVEDLLQDLFLRLETTVTGPVRSPRAYLYQMANNMAHTRRRTETRRQTRDAVWTELSSSDDQIDPTPDPEATSLARDHLARVEAGLAALPERTVHIFKQYRIERASQKDIAAQLGISLSAVEKHLQRAYRVVLELRSRFSDLSDETPRTGGFDGPSR